MVIFIALAGGATGVMLLLFLLESRFTTGKLPKGPLALCIGGCWVLLCLGGHWAIVLPAGCMAAFAAAVFLGQAPNGKALAFAALFGALYAAAFVIGCFPGLEGANAQLVRLSVLYLFVVLVAMLGPRWRTALTPMVQLLPPWLVGVLLTLLCMWQRKAPGIPMLQFFAILWQVYCGAALWPVYKNIHRKLDNARQQQEARRQYIMQEDYYRQLREKQAQTRALWHDLDKYLRAAKAETAPSEALEQLQSLLDDATAIVDVGNPVVNVILNEYMQSAKALGIELRLKVQVPQELFVSAADLYILMGNTIDNAMEACRNLPQPQRLIDLTLRTHGDMLYYRLANPYNTFSNKSEQDPLRGHGLENALRCVEAYDGQLLTQKDQGFFIVSAHMNKQFAE